DPHPYFVPRQRQIFPVTIGFSIDETGRAVDIQAVEGGYVTGKLEGSFDRRRNTLNISLDKVLLSQSTRDLMPSLRASTFNPRTPQTGCQVTYSPSFSEAASLSREQLAAIGALPGVRLSQSQRDQLGGSDCNTIGWPAVLQRGYPDWRLIAASEGARRWTWISFDIEEDGTPVNVAVIASSGHDDLDQEARRAISQNRFTEGER
ncbi:MAG: energy transducer TonB, partial [Anaerolineales bacterium]